MLGQFTALYYICEMSGLLITLGGVWLIYKEKIYLNAETKEVIQVEVPFLGRLKTNVPALGLFVIGLIVLIYPIQRSGSPAPDFLRVGQHVSSSLYPVDVYLVMRTEVLNNADSLHIDVPILPPSAYSLKLVYSVNAKIYDQRSLDPQKAKAGELVVDDVAITAVSQKTSGANLTFRPEVEPKPDSF